MALAGEVEIKLDAGSTFTQGVVLDIDELISIDPLAILDPWEHDPDQLLMEALRWPEGPMGLKLAREVFLAARYI